LQVREAAAKSRVQRKAKAGLRWSAWQRAAAQQRDAGRIHEAASGGGCARAFDGAEGHDMAGKVGVKEISEDGAGKEGAAGK